MRLAALVTVGLVDAGGARLRTLNISPDAVPLAREHGWWVFDDFKDPALTPVDNQQSGANRAPRTQADGHADED